MSSLSRSEVHPLEHISIYAKLLTILQNHGSAFSCINVQLCVSRFYVRYFHLSCTAFYSNNQTRKKSHALNQAFYPKLRPENWPSPDKPSWRSVKSQKWIATSESVIKLCTNIEMQINFHVPIIIGHRLCCGFCMNENLKVVKMWIFYAAFMRNFNASYLLTR